MELIYIYIESFRNIKNLDLTLSDKFKVTYDNTSKNISIIRNESYINNIYPSYIQNINAIVGKNGVGKTNIIDLIGMKIDDRNKNNAENKVIYKKDPKTGLHNKFVDEIKYAKYFMIYHFNDGDDKYFLEGNFIEDFEQIVLNKIPNQKYFESKSWFSFVCRNINNKLEILFDTQDWCRQNAKDYSLNKDYIPCIISFRNNYNKRIYDYNSYKPSDDYKISIPRRISHISPNLLSYKLSLLKKLMGVQTPNNTMYQNNSYRFVIECFADYMNDDKPFNEIYTHFSLAEKDKANLIESFLCYTFYHLIDSDEQRDSNAKSLKAIPLKYKTYSDAIIYYNDIFKSIIQMPEYKMKDDEISYAVDRFTQFIEALNNPHIIIGKNSIFFDIFSDTDISKYSDIIKILDDDYRFEEQGMFRIFSNFFTSRIDYLSDGEAYFLGLFSSVEEQLSDQIFCKSKKHFIVLFDEPETNMHPELARSFINQLIKFLETYSDKSFQIIIATHSPFILSDLLPGNVQLLIEQKSGSCQHKQCTISTFGANIHDILANGFFMSSTMGAYSKELLDKIIDELSGKSKSNLDKKSIAEIISIIGEPIIKRKLTDMYAKKYISFEHRSNIESLIKQIYDSSADISILRKEINKQLDYIESCEKNESNT